MKLIPVGIDMTKSVMHLLYMDEATGDVVKQSIKRVQFEEYCANRTPYLIGMASCGSAYR